MLFSARAKVIEEFRNPLVTYVVYSDSFRYFQQLSVQELNAWLRNGRHAVKINQVLGIHREQNLSPG